MLAATTLNCTMAAISQQQVGAPGLEQGVPAIVKMLVGTTGELSGASPNAEAAHLAKVGAATPAASTLHSCTWLCTMSQPYADAGPGAGATIDGNGVVDGVRKGVGDGGGGGRLPEPVPFSTAGGMVGVAVKAGVALGVAVAAGVTVGAAVAAGVTVGAAVAAGETVGAAVAVGVNVGAAVAAGVTVGAAVAVGLTVGACVTTGVTVGTVVAAGVTVMTGE